MSLYAQVQKNISGCYKSLMQQASTQCAKKTIIGVGIVMSLLVGYVSHSFYIKKREQQAFIALAEIIDSFEKVQDERNYSSNHESKDSESIWQDTEILIEALYKQNSRSYLAPYFLIFKSQIALEKGAAIDEVLKMLEEALGKMPKKTAMLDFYNLKRVLMSFESENDNIRKAALQDLIAIAKDEKGYSFEEASYALGLYYISQGNMHGARDAFQNLLKNADQKALLPSPWVKQAEEKLESVK